MVISKIIEPIFGLNLYLAIDLPYAYTSLITMGFEIMGPGLWRLFKNYEIVYT